ncbi:MAG: hypothetical protein IJ287_03155 [Methanobrevibacter sp.]|nr:hypothetical protein [Methanobrevibacter sp.]MBR1748877.1 hypothetical protein [Bacilli bacterium]
MNDEMFKHLTNLLRHSTEVEFKIPSIFFSEKFSNMIQSHEVQNAWITLQRNMDLQIYKVIEEKGLITVKISIKQPDED